MRLLSVIMATAVAAAALAGTPDSTLVRQAERAWDSGEYAAAQALYTLVADRNPSDAGATARMIVAGAIRGDTAMASKTVERALSNAVNLDTLLEAVRRDCYSCSIAPYYPQLLATLGEKMPWLLRPLRLRLLDHSMRRGDNASAACYARLLLLASPGDTSLLEILGKASIAAGDDTTGEAALREALAIEPDNHNVLLALGYWLLQTDSDEAAALLRRAYTIRPTPYLEQTLQKISKQQ